VAPKPAADASSRLASAGHATFVLAAATAPYRLTLRYPAIDAAETCPSLALGLALEPLRDRRIWIADSLELNHHQATDDCTALVLPGRANVGKGDGVRTRIRVTRLLAHAPCRHRLVVDKLDELLCSQGLVGHAAQRAPARPPP
jgi:hypothetical protein